MTPGLARQLVQPADLPELAFATLSKAAADLADPWRTPVLATALDRRPQARTVVLRGVNAASREIWCFSDLLASKVVAIGRTPLAAWCFYDLRTRTQLRLEGETVVETGSGRAEELWKTLSAEQQKNYGPEPHAGQVVSAPHEVRWTDRPFDSFAVLFTQVQSIDWLELHPEGHRRAIANWFHGKWLCNWRSP